MVGFGSSLRLARRPGWEEAYLDYEALKLLLTQIEAIYEEEAHLQQRRQEGRDLDVMFLETPQGGGDMNMEQQQQPTTIRDYRDDLFLVSDSDAAFEALMKYDVYSAEEEASDLEQAQQKMELEHQAMQAQWHNMQHQQQQQQQYHTTASPGTNANITAIHNTAASTAASQGGVQSIFSESRDLYQPQQLSLNDFGYHSGDGYAANNNLTDDDEYEDFDDEDDSQDSGANGNMNCVPANWVTGRTTKQPKKTRPKKKKPPPNQNNLGLHFRSASGRGSQFMSPSADSKFFVNNHHNHHRQNNSGDAFILDANSDRFQTNNDDEDDDDNSQSNAQQSLNTLQDLDGMSTLTSFSQQTSNRNNPSILQKPFRSSMMSGETTALLSVPSTPATGSSLFSFASQTGPVTPPPGDTFIQTAVSNNHRSRVSMPTFNHKSNTDSYNNMNNRGGVGAPVPPPNKAAVKQLEEERKQERRKRRQKKRKRAAKRKALERKVPKHIRAAHTKARDITERFLGLLRAECEKVMLFAQSRLGELADTAGSLRFPAMEDPHHHSTHSSSHYHGGGHGPTNSSHAESAQQLSPNSAAAGGPRTPASYDGYPLSDGGMHSSASSTSDDGAGGSGMFYWSDSSSDSVKSRDSGSPNVPRSLSAYRDMQQRGGSSHQKAGANRPPSARNIMDATPMKGRKHDGFDSAKRHLDHFEKLRRNRPIFQRSGNVMGEDLLLLSAVDEADGYTAVGVELMHVLRFICVNLIAVRKICRKHDQLLMNRMLGGYYHHLKMLASNEANGRWNRRQPSAPQNQLPNQRSFQDEHVQNAQTLGGLLARESADIFEPHHPAVIGQVSSYKLVGLYDGNLQQLANSRTVQVISSCLVLALSEYEVSRTRANALATLNSTGSGLPAPRRGSGSRAVLRHKQQQDQMSVMTGLDSFVPSSTVDQFDEKDEYDDADSDGEGGPPSTASSISLTRLRFTVTSIIALREAARRKKDMYSTYLSRSTLAFTGRAVVGEGLDGCSRETLDFLVSYNPDAALLMDPASLNDGLKQGMWSKRSMCSVMTSSLAVATVPVELPYAFSDRTLRQQEKVVISAVNILPKYKFVDVPDLFRAQRANRKTSTGVSLAEDDSFRSILRLNRSSHFLYTMNYYLVHPTTITFVTAVQSPPAHSSLIIGAPNAAALLSALLHCYVLSGDSKEPMSIVKSLRRLFLLASLFGMAGNVVHGYGVWKDSIAIAVLGRFIMGFSCSEILHRNIVASLLPMNRLVTETAVLVQTQILGLLCGLLVGTLAEYLPFHVTGWGVGSLSSSSWLMACLWFLQLICVCAGFRIEDGDAKERLEANNAAEIEQLLLSSSKPSSLAMTRQQRDSDSSSSSNDKLVPPSHRTSLRHTYGTADEKDAEQKENEKMNASRRKKKRKKKGRKRRLRTLQSFPNRLRRLLSYSVAVPVCLFIALYIKYAQEVLFSSCPIILNRYFRWGGGRAGIFLAALTVAIFPMNFICGQIARRYGERTVIKKSLVILLAGLVIMINYGSVVKLAFQTTDLLSETEERIRDTRYDWVVGKSQYFVGLSVLFIGLVSLDTATLSLLSKVSPPRIRSSSVALQLGTIVSFVSLAARLIADIQILVVGLSHRLINTDLVNSLVVPLMIICIIIAHFVRKHFFFLV